MKKEITLLLIAICGWLSTMQAQEYIPLSLDSIYYYSYRVDEGDTTITETFTGYTYDTDDRLIQLRINDDLRTNYTYGLNEETITTQNLVDGEWINDSRTTNLFSADVDSDDNLIEVLDESFIDGVWQNDFLLVRTYFENGERASTTTKTWDGVAWENSRFFEYAINEEGNRSSVKSFSYGDNGELITRLEIRYAYNTNRLLAQEISTIYINGEPYSGSKESYAYNADLKLDSTSRAGLELEYADSCRAPYTYSNFIYDEVNGKRTEVISDQDFDDQYYRAEIREYYEGPGIYSSLPDSTRTSLLDRSTGLVTYIENEEFNHYEALNETDVYSEHVYNLYDEEGMINIHRYRERFYHRSAVTVSTENLIVDDHTSLFPNPVKGGEVINIKNANATEAVDQVSIYNSVGKLISQSATIDHNQFAGPTTPGVFFVNIKYQDGTMNTQKLLVQ